VKLRELRADQVVQIGNALAYAVYLGLEIAQHTDHLATVGKNFVHVSVDRGKLPGNGIQRHSCTIRREQKTQGFFCDYFPYAFSHRLHK
jgi:hypothetical protein